MTMPPSAPAEEMIYPHASRSFEGVRLEITADHPEALLAAVRGGAHRIELCASLADGGLTPSIGLMQWARANTTLPIHAMVRPRAGNFVYSAAELSIMEHDIRALCAARADGVVLGVLTPEGQLDLPALARLVAAARPMRVVLHRAFDLVADQPEALEDAIRCGVDAILTSGGAPSLEQGLSRIVALAAQAAGRIEIIGGAGVRLSNAARLWAQAPITTLHASMRSAWRRGRHRANPAGVSMGTRDTEELYTVREEDVRALAALLPARNNVTAPPPPVAAAKPGT